jgi:hypothetical protein
VKSWEDGQYNILNMSVEETFGLGILQEGQAIAVAKNVNIQMNEFVMTAPYQVSSSLAATSFDTRAGQPETRRLQAAINTPLFPAGVASFVVGLDAGYSQVVVSDGVVVLHTLRICMVLLSTEWISSPAGGF